MKHLIRRLALSAIVFAGPLHAQAAPVPILLSYQGRVAVRGVNFDSATAGRPGKFYFALVTPDGPEGTLYWRNSREENGDNIPDDAVELTVTKGLYSVMLGDVSIPHMAALPQVESTFSQPDLRLRVWFDDGVHGAQLLTPDQRLAPAAYFADRSIKRDAIGAGEILSSHLAAGAVESANIAAGAIRTEHFYPGQLDFSILKTKNGAAPGKVLGFDGGMLSWVAPGGGGGIWTLSESNDAYYSGGKVGIGTATPEFKLVVADAGVSQLGFSGYGIRSGYLGNGTEFDGGELQIQGGWSNNNGGRIRLGGNGRTDADRNVVQFLQNSVERMRIHNNGNVGIGSSDPVGRLEVIGSDALRLIGDRPYLTIYDSSTGYPASRIQGVGGAIIFETHSYTLNGGNNYARLNSDGSFTVKTLTIRGGADLAEPFEMKEEELEKGSVVVIDDEHPGRLKSSRGAYDTRVAGIVSGANGVNPGIALHQEGVIEGGQNIALSGRVYARADASSSPIKPGDLLTTSDSPGCAMKATDHTRAQGAILGKAMTSLADGSGMVLVLVTLQ